MIDVQPAAESKIHSIRRGLLVTGLALSLLAVVCMVAPFWITTPLEWLVGGAMCLSGCAGAFHLLVGYLARLRDWKRNPPQQLPEPNDLSAWSVGQARKATAWSLVLVQIVLGGALLWWPNEISPFLFLVFLLAVAAEGAIIVWASFHFHSMVTKAWMWLAGLLSVTVAVAALYNWSSPDADRLVGILIGTKLLLIGLIFIRVGWSASESDLRSAYVGLSSFQDDPKTGSIYAVYFGPAFHCGICIGERRIVDYHSDGIVICVSWDQFLKGRQAMEWNYPDIHAGDPAAISSFATSLVGKFTPYDVFKFSCENFAIYCRALGATSHSDFTQAAVGAEFARQKPFLAATVQFLNRAASWFLYGAGGPFGKKFGFAMIRVARALTDWVVARPLRTSQIVHDPHQSYLPAFEEVPTPLPSVAD